MSAAFLSALLRSSTGTDRLGPLLSDSSTVEQVLYKQQADLFTFNKGMEGLAALLSYAAKKCTIVSLLETSIRCTFDHMQHKI